MGVIDLKYFIDTSFLVGIANEKDKYHIEANDWLLELNSQANTQFFISDYVIDEFLNVLIKETSIKDAIEWGKLIYSQELATIIYCTQKINQLAWDLVKLEINERKPMNLTDCVVYVKKTLMKCDEILTFDNRLKNFNGSI